VFLNIFSLNGQVRNLIDTVIGVYFSTIYYMNIKTSNILDSSILDSSQQLVTILHISNDV